MARLPNFTRGTRGKDESRSSVKEVLTSKPRAVINPNFSFGHFDVARAGSNYNVVAPSKRGWTGKMFKLKVESTNLSDFHGSTVSVTDPLGSEVIFQFSMSSFSVSGVKDGGRVTVGIRGMTSQETIAGKFFTTFRNSLGQGYQRYLDVEVAQFERTSNYDIILKTTDPFVGASDMMPYIQYGSFAAAYTGGTGITSVTAVGGTSDSEVIQPPFSVASRILRGS